jgi:DhnA family fructose-bisphosphate aldolase class Ia
MTRIDRTDRLTAPALELLGQVIDEARAAGVEALIESLSWRDGAMARDTDAIVRAAVIAHDLGAPLLKVPVPDVAPGRERTAAVARVVESVGVPVLFLGGPRGRRRSAGGPRRGGRRHGRGGGGDGRRAGSSSRTPIRPTMAKMVADAVHGG